MKHVLDAVHIGATWRIRLNRLCQVTLTMQLLVGRRVGEVGESVFDAVC